ncbi:MAG: hypothetical protein J6A28_04855 [Clostridia bacterium]|nr:hypothetical protein [Clostridia bacterium]
MKITYSIDKAKFANMVIAGKDKMTTKQKVSDARFKKKVAEVEMEQ